MVGNYDRYFVFSLLQPTEEIFPKDENGKIIYEDDKTDITETWKVHIHARF